MAKFVIQGPQRLQGEIAVSGAKNAALKAIPAALLAQGETALRRVPQLRDVEVMCEIVRSLGGKAEQDASAIRIDAQTLSRFEIIGDLSGQARTSIMLVPVLLKRFGKAVIGHPGGCAIGRRPIDQFLEGFKAFGASVKDRGDAYEIFAADLKGTTYFFPFISVTATETLMMLGTAAKGATVLKNAAQEPEVAALADYLNRSGARISGAGTPTIYVEGASELKSAGSYEMIPDRLETGMFAILAAATGSRVRISKCNPEHVESMLVLFDRMGVSYSRGRDWLEVEKPTGILKSPGKVITHEYPGFATDLQPPLTVLLTQAQGATLVHETIFEGRLFYVDLLNRMGANIILCDPHRALVQGPTALRGKRLESPDIRAGIAMLIAGLMAKGETVIDNIYQIERGFEKIEERLRGLGAKIERVE